MKKIVFIVLLLQSLQLKTSAQVKTLVNPTIKFKLAPLTLQNKAFRYLQASKTSILPFYKSNTVFANFNLPANFYTQQLKGMCRVEYKVQQTIKLPLYFRLGSLAYTNYLEGK
jgi:hypothetical protein